MEHCLFTCFDYVRTVHAVDMTPEPEQYRLIVDINLTGPFLCAQAAAQVMIAQKKRGSIIMTASISAHRPNYP